MRLLKKTAFLAVALLMLSACGQRGPLYVPSDDANTATTATTENTSNEKAQIKEASTTDTDANEQPLASNAQTSDNARGDQ
jgi:predicted small lipoprotein YifL